MRSFLRWLLNFIETRFPEKVEVTPKEYAKMRDEVCNSGQRFIELSERLTKIESEVQKFNYAMGFGGMPKGSNGVLER